MPGAGEHTPSSPGGDAPVGQVQHLVAEHLHVGRVVRDDDHRDREALLLDEPFAALDGTLRAKLRGELVDLQHRLAIPMVVITHDPADVDVLGDEVLHLADGRISSK